MKKLEPYPIAIALFFIFTVLFAICIIIKLILLSFGIEGFWHMHRIWAIILPGFKGLDSLSILIGLLEVSLGSYLLGYIVVPLYNLLIKKKVIEHKIDVKPVIVRFQSLFTTFTVYVSLLFSLCLLYDLVVPPYYQMLNLWKLLLPGFTELTFLSYLIGLVVIIIYSSYTAFIFSITLNLFEKSELNKSEVNFTPQSNTSDKGPEMLSIVKDKEAGKKYDAKYLGIVPAIFATLIFILIVINMFLSGKDYSSFIKPFIPFFNSLNSLNIIGGITVSFLWGWVLGYFFMIFYHWFSPSQTLPKGKGF